MLRDQTEINLFLVFKILKIFVIHNFAIQNFFWSSVFYRRIKANKNDATVIIDLINCNFVLTGLHVSVELEKLCFINLKIAPTYQ